ncbi:MAG TPA: PIG-L deacetylase family protein [Gaiellaceae bacterium]
MIRRDNDLTMPPVVGAPTEPLVVIAPHSDDESIGCGGVLALADRASVLLLTGDESRRAEAQEALEVLGVTDLECLEFRDGRLGEEAELSKRLEESIAARAPGTLLIPYPLDRHRDHVAAARAVASAPPDCELWCYEVWTPLDPNRLVDITDVAEAKRAAIERHRSQLERHAYADAALGLNAYRALLAPPARFAEAYLRVTADQLRQLLGISGDR